MGDEYKVWKVTIVMIILFTFSWINLSQGIQEFCMLKPQRGPCGDSTFKYFYSPEEMACRLFVFGGCYVNDNKFDTEEECLDICTRNASLVTTTTTTTTIAPDFPFLESGFVILENGTGKATFTFASPSSFIQIGPQEISSYQIRNRRSLSLQFRTRQPHALLIYHGIKNRPSKMNKYELYVMLDQGQLKVKHLFGDYSTTLVVGKGLNRDKWHHVTVIINPHERTIEANVDAHSNIATIIGLKEFPMYQAENVDLESVIFIGGLKAGQDLEVSYLANPFVGCIQHISFATSSQLTPPLEPLSPLVSYKFNNVVEKCINKCRSRDQPCAYDSSCINHYDHLECDCFNAKYKGDECRNSNIPVLTLYGYSYVTFSVYEWMDRVHSDANRISLQFSTEVDDSILFYAAGEIPYHNHISVIIKEAHIFVNIDFGDGGVISAHMGSGLTSGDWHTLTINHHGQKVSIELDKDVRSFDIFGKHHHIYIDPDIYIGGGGPILKNRQGLNSSNNFVGCLREVYFNEKQVLWDLREGRHQVSYHGATYLKFDGCELQKTVPITVPFAESGFQISNPSLEELDLKFEFRTIGSFVTIAYSDILTSTGEGFWELKIMNEEFHFVLQPDKDAYEIPLNNTMVVRFNRKGAPIWHSVHLKYMKGEVVLKTDKATKTQEFTGVTQLSPFVTLGTSLYKPNLGFVGCMRNVKIGNLNIDSREIVGSEHQIGDIAMDNCQYENPCDRLDVCEHDGICSVVRGETACDCSKTGYIGKHCHFAIFKRTCEELALLGYTDPGVYKIDIDGNGPHKPVNVTCKFETNSFGETKTIVEHDLANETEIWEPVNELPIDFKLNITYREFSPDMLMSLISQSVQCSQHLKYECSKAPLALHQFTWFKSADQTSSSVVSIGDGTRGSCPCAETNACVLGESCNCDGKLADWLSDEGYYSLPDRSGITEMYFMVPNNLSQEAKSRITLGPLECVEANTQRYVVTFKTFGSYLEAPGWKSGDLAFSFRTTRSSAILLYQPLLHPQHNAFSVFLANEHELIFRFILNGGQPQRVVVRSQRPLSRGDWQQVWIDYDLHQVRFQINAEHQMINLLDGQQFGPFEGTMYIAGAPLKYVNDETVVQDGLIGCFRGLVMNGQVVDLYSYMKFHKADIVKDCSPSCDPNPCKNNAVCQENWGSFVCQCKNPWAQSGEFCEKDINVDGLTFLSQSSFIKKARSDAALDPIRNILSSNIFVNLRTYDTDALVLYANDNLNNFVQIHIQGGAKVIFTWNDGYTIRQLFVKYKNLNQGKPIQIAVTRNNTYTALHVNQESNSIAVNVSLITQYLDNPWRNPGLETFTPPRPFAPVSTYYQLFLGGYDNNALKPVNDTKIPGMLGCLRGLSVGNDSIKLIGMANNADVLEGCKMVCDSKPCLNGGLCLEDFQSRTYSCDCTHTSFFGRICVEERGANLFGESYIRKRFKHSKPTVDSIEAHFGFSTSYSEADTLLIAIQIPDKNYSVVFAINKEGHFLLREQRQGIVVGAIIQYQNFIDGSRHAVYFRRTGIDLEFIVDQKEIELSVLDGFQAIGPEQDPNVGNMYVGGVNDKVDELKAFKRFKGCLSNIYAQVGDIKMSPVEEYMGHRKNELDEIIDGENQAEIKQGACAPFSLFRVPDLNAPLNDLEPSGQGADWVKVHVKHTKIPIYMRTAEEEQTGSFSFRTMAIIFGTILGFFAIYIAIYLCRLNKSYKRRKEEEFFEEDTFFTHRSQPIRYNDPMKSEVLYTGYQSKDPEKTELLKSDKYPRPLPYNETSFITNGGNPGLQVNPNEDTPEGIDDENASSDTSADDKSSLSRASSLSLNETQALDEKEVEDLVLNDSNNENSLPNTSSAYEEIPDAEEDDDDRLKKEYPYFHPKTKPMPPLFLNTTVRHFPSPAAIIGGLNYHQLKRNSKDSILSLD